MALWNGYADDQNEYNRWHTREHVLERLTLPGFVSARRYRRTTGPLPDYLTLYWLSGQQALESLAYRALLEHPSEWSLDMRDGLTDVMRHAYTDAVHFGCGIGAEAVVKIAPYRRQLRDVLSSFFSTPHAGALTSAMSARLVPNLTALPFLTSTRGPAPPDTAMLLLEGYDADMLRAVLPSLDEQLEAEDAVGDWTFYRLAFLAGEEDAVAPMGRAASLARAS